MEKTAASTEPIRPEVLSAEQLAMYIGCGRTYAYKLISDGSIPSFKLGRLRRVRRSDADRFIERLAEDTGE